MLTAVHSNNIVKSTIKTIFRGYVYSLLICQFGPDYYYFYVELCISCTGFEWKKIGFKKN